MSKRKKLTQQIPQCRGSCTAVPVVHGKYRYLLYAVVLVVVVCVATVPALRGTVRGLIMLFTQKSVHTLTGALRAQQWFCVPYAVFLAAFRAAVLPWIPPLLTLACQLVFGNTAGFLVALASSATAGSFCFLLSRLLLRPFLLRLQHTKLIQVFFRGGGVFCCVMLLLLPGSIGFAGYLFGMTGVSYCRFLSGVTVGESAVILAYFLCCSPYKTLLSKNVRVILAVVGLLVLMLYMFLVCYNRKKEKHQA